MSGPAPYPALVRDLQRVIGDEARAQMLEREGRLPQRVIACVGGGSNSIGMFIPFVDDAEVELVGVEAAGEGIETGRHGAPLTAAGCPACCTAPTRRSCRTRTARSSRRIRSRPGSTTPAAVPSTPGCATRAGPGTWRSPTSEALEAFAATARLEGIIPALESSHALAWAMSHPDSELDVVCLSGRGDKDLAEALAHLAGGRLRPRAHA